MLSFFKKKQEIKLKAFLSGKIIPIDKVPDEVFASKAMGEGIAIDPENNIVIAPADGVISIVMESSKHAVGLTLNNGAELLIHVGIDTVNMNGEGFEVFVKAGDKVKAGEKLIRFDKDLIVEKGFKSTTMMVLTNIDNFPNTVFNTEEEKVTSNEAVVATFR